VKIVADEGEMMYFFWIAANNASLKPEKKLAVAQSPF
jgi:hypothetical protein